MTDLLIVVVSYNARPDLEQCLSSLHAHPPGTPHEIVVVDNASDDGSVEAVGAGWPDVHVVALTENLGFARANNRGIRARGSELILLLNSDTRVPTGAVDALVETLRAHDDVAAVGPHLVDAEGRTEISYGRMIGPLNEVRQKVLGHLYARGHPLARSLVARSTRGEHACDWVSGACLLVRRDDAEAVGLLDERFFMYGEDVDFCADIRRRGRRVLFTPAAEVVHLRGRSRAAAPQATQRAYRRSHLAFYAKHHPRWLPLLRAYLRLKGELPD